MMMIEKGIWCVCLVVCFVESRRNGMRKVEQRRSFAPMMRWLGKELWLWLLTSLCWYDGNVFSFDCNNFM